MYTARPSRSLIVRLSDLRTLPPDLFYSLQTERFDLNIRENALFIRRLIWGAGLGLWL